MHSVHRPRLVSPAPMRASLAAFGAFALVASIAEPSRLDRALYRRARTHHHGWLEQVQRPLEIFGLPGFHIPIALIAARVLGRRRHRGGPIIATAALSGWLTVRLMRVLVHRPRPPRPAGRGPKRESTFPSGHTTELTSLAIAAAHVLEHEHILTRGQARAIRFGVPLLIGVNRVYVREHWFTDVLGGWTLGIAVSLACIAALSD